MNETIKWMNCAAMTNRENISLRGNRYKVSRTDQNKLSDIHLDTGIDQGTFLESLVTSSEQMEF
eukprot:scaffold15408_cov41-Cyclotella_meneghiniana.AAC.14